LPKSTNKSKDACPECSGELKPLAHGYECLKCGLLMMADGGVVYNPNDPKWHKVTAEK